MSGDIDALRRAHQFIPGADSATASAGNGDDRLAATYSAALVKDVALCDLSRAPQLGLRWRTRAEVLNGKGELVCGSLTCEGVSGILSFEVPFKYLEHGEKKAALVKLNLCGLCANRAFADRMRADAASEAAAGASAAPGDAGNVPAPRERKGRGGGGSRRRRGSRSRSRSR